MRTLVSFSSFTSVGLLQLPSVRSCVRLLLLSSPGLLNGAEDERQ